MTVADLPPPVRSCPHQYLRCRVAPDLPRFGARKPQMRLRRAPGGHEGTRRGTGYAPRSEVPARQGARPVAVSRWHRSFRGSPTCSHAVSPALRRTGRGPASPGSGVPSSFSACSLVPPLGAPWQRDLATMAWMRQAMEPNPTRLWAEACPPPEAARPWATRSCSARTRTSGPLPARSPLRRPSMSARRSPCISCPTPARMPIRSATCPRTRPRSP